MSLSRIKNILKNINENRGGWKSYYDENQIERYILYVDLNTNLIRGIHRKGNPLREIWDSYIESFLGNRWNDAYIKNNDKIKYAIERLMANPVGYFRWFIENRVSINLGDSEFNPKMSTPPDPRARLIEPRNTGYSRMIDKADGLIKDVSVGIIKEILEWNFKKHFPEEVDNLIKILYSKENII